MLTDNRFMETYDKSGHLKRDEEEKKMPKNAVEPGVEKHIQH